MSRGAPSGGCQRPFEKRALRKPTRNSRMNGSRASRSSARNPRKFPGKKRNGVSGQAAGAASNGLVPARLAFGEGSRNRRFYSENAQCENTLATRA